MSGAVAAAVALAAAYLTGWLVRRRWGDRALDRPGPRSSHAVPTTRLGGLAVAAGLAAGLVAGTAGGALPARLLAGLLVGSGIAAAAGLVEDVRGLPVPVRLAAQLLAGGAGAALLVDGSPVGAVVAAAWVVAFTNVYNFMDGANGLAAAQLAVAGAAWLAIGVVDDVAVLRILGAVALATAIGFLPHNFPQAQVFMGDSGAYGAGAWLALGTVAGIRAGAPPVAMAAPLAVFVADASWTLAGRVRRGENVLTAHRAHLYQGLLRAGWSHARTAGFVVAAMAVTAVAGLAAVAGTAAAVAGGLAGLAAVAGYVALATAAARSRGGGRR